MMKMKIWFSKLYKKFINLKQKKFLTFGVIFAFLLFSILSFTAYLSIRNDLHKVQNFTGLVLNNQTKNITGNYQGISEILFKWDKRLNLVNNLSFGLLESRFKFKKWLVFSENFVPLLPEIFGKNGEKTYLVLLQNDKELRPTGGFLGSYAKLKFSNGGLSSVTIQDIYVPDGQISGHVDPPKPIQEAFKQGWWKLRDSNWDPNFPESAKIIDWFFEKGKEEKNDGIIAVNFSFLEEIVEILGPIDLPEYNLTVNKDNFYQVAQSYSEVNFFPGSTQKKDILSHLGQALIEKTKKIDKKQLKDILISTVRNLQQRQILGYFKNDLVQNSFEAMDWTGRVKKNTLFSENTINDYLYIVESNLGANKANCCISRKVNQQISFQEDGNLSEKLDIIFNNESQFNTPQPPVFWGGNYINYLRIYLPIEVQDIKVTIDGEVLSEELITVEELKPLNLKNVGFFVTIPNLSSKQVTLKYLLPLENKNPKQYSLYVQKQPGIKSLPFTFEVEPSAQYAVKLKNQKNSGKELKISKEILNDEEFLASFEYNIPDAKK